MFKCRSWVQKTVSLNTTHKFRKKQKRKPIKQLLAHDVNDTRHPVDRIFGYLRVSIYDFKFDATEQRSAKGFIEWTLKFINNLTTAVL